MEHKARHKKNITIKQRLAISNLLMILVPVVILAFIGLVCMAAIWFSVRFGDRLDFDDSDDFYQASRDISMMVEASLGETGDAKFPDHLAALCRLLDENAIAVSVDCAGINLYNYGRTTEADASLLDAAAVVGGEGFISNGRRELYVRQPEINGARYRIAVFASPSEMSHHTFRAALLLSAAFLILVILLTVLLTNRFLTKFVFQKIEQPLDILADGVRQISEGNLEHRIVYSGEDEFSPVCADFNEMAARLRASEERTRQHEQSRKELLAGVSHDLRSPLTSIRAYVEGLLDGVAKTPEAQRGYLEIINSKAGDINRMLTKIFLFSKMELGEYPISPERLRLDDEVRQLIRALDAEYREKGLALSAGGLVPATVSIDPEQLRRVLTNITENSLKYKTKDVGSLIITLREEQDGYRLTLCDDGPGVSEDALPHLFEVFYRSDPARQNPHRGSGLGLAIAANAIQRMNGTIAAKTGKNGGLAIIIRLPKAEE